MEWTNIFVVGFITFQSVLLWQYYTVQRQKSLPDIGGTTIQDGGTTIQDVAPLAAMGDAMEPGRSTPWAMSLYFKFRAIYFWLLNEFNHEIRPKYITLYDS